MIGSRSQGAGPPGSIDFELTDFSEARHALDDLPAGVREVGTMSPGYWEQRRRKPLPTDRALTGAAMEWLVNLPPQVRPRELSEQFPRIVNLIAAGWSDAIGSRAALARLLDDGRPGRRGFPAAVEAEIRTLARHREATP